MAPANSSSSNSQSSGCCNVYPALATLLVLGLESLNRIRDNSLMARKIRTGRQLSGLYHAREARHMSRSELVRLSGVSKQQLSRLEGGQIRMRLDHLKPFAKHLGYTPEQILLWGRYPGTGEGESSGSREEPLRRVPELDTRADSGGGVPKREVRKDGRHADPIKHEAWVFPASFVREQLHSSPEQLLVIEANGDSMSPTVVSGDRVIVDTGHKTPTPDGLYAFRDAFAGIVIKRLQVMHPAKQAHVKIISDNPRQGSEEVPLSELEVVGKVVCCLKLS
jgi:transcriptional regulator with XRE-family HTH domain